MISSSQNLSLLFLSDSIHGKRILCWTVSKEEEDWEFELFLAKEQENGLPLLSVTLNTKLCESTEFSNSSGCCVRETTVKRKKKKEAEFVSSLNGEVSVYKRQRKSALKWMNSSTLTTPTCHPRKHINHNATNFTFINCIETQSACHLQNQDYPIMSLPPSSLLLVATVASITFSCDLQPDVNNPFTYFRCH